MASTASQYNRTLPQPSIPAANAAAHGSPYETWAWVEESNRTSIPSNRTSIPSNRSASHVPGYASLRCLCQALHLTDSPMIRRISEKQQHTRFSCSIVKLRIQNLSEQGAAQKFLVEITANRLQSQPPIQFSLLISSMLNVRRSGILKLFGYIINTRSTS